MRFFKNDLRKNLEIKNKSKESRLLVIKLNCIKLQFDYFKRAKYN